MAIDFTPVETTPWIGAVNGIPTTLCGTRGRWVLVNINWNIYGVGNGDNLGLTVDMKGIAPASQLDLIRSVYIDNLSSPTAIYVNFPDTNFSAFCPPYSAGWVPVITNGTQATIYGIGFNSSNVPLTNVFFTNIFVPNQMTTAGVDANITPVQMNYLGTAVSTPGAGAFATVFTFNAFPFGTAAAARRIVIGALGSESRNTGPSVIGSIASMTIGGIAATLGAQANVSQRLAVGAVDQSYNWNGGTAIAAVPTGATGTVVVTQAVARNSCRIFGWEVIGVTSDSILNSVAVVAGGGLNLSPGVLAVSNTINVAARGAAAGFCFGSNRDTTVPAEPTLTGATKDTAAGSLDVIAPNSFAGNYDTLSNPYAINDIVSANPAQLIQASYSNVVNALMCSVSLQPS